MVVGCLASDSESRSARVVEAGWVDVVVTALRAYPAQYGIQCNGCGLLAKLIEGSDERAKAVGASGGVEARPVPLARATVNPSRSHRACAHI